MRSRFVFVAFLSLASLLGCRTPQTLRPFPDRYLADAAALAARSPLAEGESFRGEDLHRSEHSSFHLVQVRGELRPHFHRYHEETVFVVSGGGIISLAEEEQRIGPGFALRIPKGMVHSFRSEGEKPCVVLVVYCPPFDGKVRHFIGDTNLTVSHGTQ